MLVDENEHHWVSTDKTPDGCVELEFLWGSGEVVSMCSCDYWWLKEDKPTHYRYSRDWEKYVGKLGENK